MFGKINITGIITSMIVEISLFSDMIMEVGDSIYNYLNRSNSKPLIKLIKEYNLEWINGIDVQYRNNILSNGNNSLSVLDHQTIRILDSSEIVSGYRVGLLVSYIEDCISG